MALEAWACGCPVVVAAHGALPELAGDGKTGVVFQPGGDAVEAQNVEGLEEAIEQGLRLRESALTSTLCREKALAYSWQALGPAFEDVYGETARPG